MYVYIYILFSSPFWRQCGSSGMCPARWDSKDVPGPPCGCVVPAGAAGRQQCDWFSFKARSYLR